MVSQCAYCYSSNRKSPNPFSALLFTSLNGRTKARLDMLGTYQNWKGVEWWEEGYDALWEAPRSPTAQEASEQKDGPAAGEFICPVTGTVGPRTRSSKESVVYLTANSDVELLELSPEETYVIGGIVDKNRYKVGSFP
jgi:tRNA (guanine9-N1)-methyltransferase